MADDVQLLRQYADQRADDAFAALVERHVSFVYAAALRQLGGAVHRAEDVTQTVFINLARQAAVVARRDDLVGWLYTATRNAAANLKRTEARRQAREEEAHIMHELFPGSSGGAEWDRLRPVLDDAIHELSEHDRRAILLRFFQNQRFAEVGRKLGLSEDAARMRVERALEKLHLLLARRGITSTTGALATVLAEQGLVAAPAALASSATAIALSGAAASGGSLAVTLLSFMTATKGTLILSAAAALAITAAIYETQSAHAAEISRAGAEQARAAQRVRLDGLEA